MGIPIEPGEEDTSDVNADPFERYAMISEDEEAKKSEAMSWSYSQYMQALEEEEVLNDVDQNTFSSIISRPKSGESSNHSAGHYCENSQRTKPLKFKSLLWNDVDLFS